MPQKHEELHRLLAFEMGRQSDGHEVLGPLPSDGCEVFFLALGQDPAHLALNRQRRLVQFEEPQLCLGLLHAHECLDADRHLDFEFLPGDFAAPVSSPDPLDHLSALLPVIRLIQFTLVFQTGFLAHRFELQVLILDLRLQLVGLMLLKLKELLATPLDSLPFVGHLILFVEIRMIQSLQFIELLLIFDVVVPLLYQLRAEGVAEVLRVEQDLPFEPVKHVQAHIVQHLCEPGLSFATCGAQVDLDDPRIKCVIQHEIKSVNFETVLGITLLGILEAFQGSVNGLLDFRKHVVFPAIFWIFLLLFEIRFEFGARKFDLFRLFLVWFWRFALLIRSFLVLFLVALFLYGIVRQVAERVGQVIQGEGVGTESNIRGIEDICVERIP